MNTRNRTRWASCIAACAFAAQASAEVTLFENVDFSGRSFTTEKPAGNLRDYGFNDRASSVVVQGESWQLCDDAGFGGRCVVLPPGRYPSLAAMGLNDRVSSARAVITGYDADRPPPPYATRDEYRRRDDERLYSANVDSVRAVVTAAGQHCWVERERVPAERGEANVPGALAGALIGGILGHQIGGGTGKDIATVGGAVGGAYVGSNVGRDGSPETTRDVQRCAPNTTQARPEYWDVTYTFRGVVHHVQMTSPPGRTVTVNRQGEPRV